MGVRPLSRRYETFADSAAVTGFSTLVQRDGAFE
jgi:hypothetical protein